MTHTPDVTADRSWYSTVPGAQPQPVVVDDLTVAYPSRTVIDGLDLVLAPGERTGLVGENGVGKTTLLRALAGRQSPRAVTTGRVVVPEATAFLPQEPTFAADANVASTLERALGPLRRLVDRLERLGEAMADPGGEGARSTAAEYSRTLDLAVAHDAWDAERRAQVAAARLGVDSLAPGRLMSELSGGQRSRLVLATLMVTRPSALLLDEPSNHLDDDALAVLAEFLVDLPGVVVLSTHDRVLLDDVCTHIVDLDDTPLGTDGSGGRRFRGTWSEFAQAKAASRVRWEERWRAEQEEITRLRAATRIEERSIAPGRGPKDNDKFIHAFKGARVQATVARRRRDAERRLEEAERASVAKPRPPLRFAGALTGAAGRGVVVQVRDLEVRGRLRLGRLDVVAGQHLLITGANGAGKSTLLGAIAGRVRPTAGEVSVGARRVTELAQDVVFPDPSRTPLDLHEAATRSGGGTSVALRDLGLLAPRDLTRPVGLLSVGQRRRLGLALALADAPDLLLLDEPTNHLSPTLAGELEEALGTSPGTVLLASHDRWLRRRWEGATLHLG